MPGTTSTTTTDGPALHRGPAAPMAAFPTILGGRVRLARCRAGLSQEGLAVRAGVSAKTVWRLETGATATPDARTIERIARVLGVAPVDLYDPAALDRFLSGRNPDFGAGPPRSA